MINNNNTLYCLLCVFSLFLPAHSQAALSQDPALNWRTLYTKHFAIHFHDGEKTLAHHVGAISESVHTKLTKKFDWVPHKRTQIVLTDRLDYANGSATPLPRNKIFLQVTPPTGSSVIADYDNWLEMLITHEYTHTLHLDKVSGFPATLQKIFGRNLFLFPNILQPPWLIEGLATYQETDVKHGIGRGQSSLFRGLMRQEVARGIKPLRQVNQPLVSWPLNTTRYLYGVYFYQFIAEIYGEEKLIELIEQYSNNLLPFAINSNSKKVLGKDMSTLWQEFSTYLQEIFLGEIEHIRQEGEVTGNPLTHSGYYIYSPQALKNGDIYYLENNLQSEPRLMMLRQGITRPEIIADTRGSSFDLHPTAGIIGTEINAINSTNLFSDLYHIDLSSKQKTLLTHGKRYLRAAWSPDGQQIIAVHNQLGQNALHRLDAHGNYIDTLWQGTDNTVIGSIDWSPDGKNLVMSVWRPGTLWNIELFDIQHRQWRMLAQNTAIESTPHFSDNGQSIVYSADYDGTFNIYQLALGTDTPSIGHPEKLTNVIGEATSPILHGSTDGEQLVYIGLGKNGYDLFLLPVTTPITTISTINTNTNTRIAETTPPSIQPTKIEPYDAFKRITPTSWFPYFLIDDVHSEVGFTTFGEDPLRQHLYSALLGYDTDNQWLMGSINYIYDRWNPTWKFSLTREVLIYLDNNNEVKRYRNADKFSMEAIWPFFRYEQQWLLHAAAINKIESDKKVLSNFNTVPTYHDQLMGVAISYNSSHRYARSISPSYGRRVRLVAEDSKILRGDYSGQIYTVDWQELIDLPGQHVGSIRTVLGWGTKNPRAFYLGGTLETSIPPTPQSAALTLTENIFGHRRYPLHGYKEGRQDLRGRRMALMEIEWRFPISLVERGFMAPPVGLHQLHGKLLYNWGEAWNQGSKIPTLRRGAGIELTTELVLGYWLPIDLRFGYATGFDSGGEKQAYLEAGIPLF